MGSVRRCVCRAWLGWLGWLVLLYIGQCRESRRGQRKNYRHACPALFCLALPASSIQGCAAGGQRQRRRWCSSAQRGARRGSGGAPWPGGHRPSAGLFQADASTPTAPADRPFLQAHLLPLPAAEVSNGCCRAWVHLIKAVGRQHTARVPPLFCTVPTTVPHPSGQLQTTPFNPPCPQALPTPSTQPRGSCQDSVVRCNRTCRGGGGEVLRDGAPGQPPLSGGGRRSAGGAALGSERPPVPAGRI